MPLLGQVPSRYVLAEDPAKAKAAAFELMGYKMYAPEVVAFHQSAAPLRVLSAPARTSKSMSAFAESVAIAMPTKPLTSTLTWLIGPTYEINKEWDYTWECLVDNRERWGFSIDKARNNPKGGDMCIVLNWGKDETGRTQRAVFRGMSSTNENALQGEEVTTAVLSEAARHPAHILSKYLGTRVMNTILPTTPSPDAEWIKALVEEGEKDTSLGIAHFTYPPSANPAYNRERFEREKKKAELRSQTGNAEDDPYFAEQFLGRWVYYTGLVLPFNPRRHVIDIEPAACKDAEMFVSLDYGYDDPSVALFWAVTPSGLVILDEIYEKKLTTDALVDSIQSRAEARGWNISYRTGDPSRPEVERVMRDAGMSVFTMDKNAQRDRAAGHRRLVDLLSQGPVPGFPGLFIHRRCAKTIAELKHLRYREGMKDEFGKTAFEGSDHAYDAMRYGVMTRPSAKRDQEPVDWLVAHKRKLAMKRPMWGAAPRRGGLTVTRRFAHAR